MCSISLSLSRETAMEITTMAEAMQLHAQLLKSCHHDQQTKKLNLSKIFTFSALSPSGDLTYARHILGSVNTPNSYYYNTMLRAYSGSSDPTDALVLFLRMHLQLHPNSPRPDRFTYPFVLRACSRLRRTQFGKQIHSLIHKSGLGSDRYIQHSLIHLYSGLGELNLALQLFEKISVKDVVSWTSIIDGLVDNFRPIEAIRLFEQMVKDGVDPNDATVVSVLRACADAGALSVGEKVNKIVNEQKLSLKANVRTALIDMYAKCGCLDSALRVFSETGNNDIFSWTAIIAGLASHGQFKDAIDYFEQMSSSDIKPDEKTMTAVLSACRNAGCVTEGLSYFRNMKKNYNIRPTIQHYGCIVDLLSRAGHLEEAENFIRAMPVEPDAVLWRTLIWACKIHGDIDRAEHLVKHFKLINLDSNDSGSYVLLENVYASAGKWHNKANTRKLMNRRGLTKPPGISRIHIDGVAHEFIAGDSGHLEAENIYEKLDDIAKHLRVEGYDPKLREVLLEIDDEEKASQLLHHSEKLAVALGLIKTSPGTTIRIVKNLRSCEDCHSFIKLASRVYQREFIIRDRIRFHHFRNGECSCGNFW